MLQIRSNIIIAMGVEFVKKGKLTGAALTSLIYLYLSSGEATASSINDVDTDSLLSDMQNGYIDDSNYEEAKEIISRIKRNKEVDHQHYRIYIQDSEDVPEWIRTNFKADIGANNVAVAEERKIAELDENIDNDNVDRTSEIVDSNNEIEASIVVCDEVCISDTDNASLDIIDKEKNKVEINSEEKTTQSVITSATEDTIYSVADNYDKKVFSLSDFDTLRKNAEAELNGYLKRHIGAGALRLLVVKLKWQNKYSYDEKVAYLIGYGAAINKSDLPESAKHELIDMMCQVFSDDKSYKKEKSQYVPSSNDYNFLPISDIEFRLDDKIDEGEIYYLLPELKKKVINIAALSRNIQYINERGTKVLEVQFQPLDGGKYKAIVLAKSNKADNISISEANTGNVYSGKWKTSIRYNNNNFTHKGDSLAFVASASPNKYDNVYQLYAMYSYFLPIWGDDISFYYGYSNSDLGVVSHIGGYDIVAHGKAESAGIAYHKNFIYKSNKKSILSIGLDYKHYTGGHEFEYNGIPWVLSKYDVVDNSISVEYSSNIKTSKSALSYSFGLAYGIGGDKDSFSSYRYNAEPGYLIGKAGLQYFNRLPGDGFLIFRINGQYTKNNLLTIDQIGAGGANTVRGFSENIANGDIGYIASLELYTPPIGKFGRFLAFIDTSYLCNNTYNIGEMHKELSSVGIGYRLWAQDGWNISINYGKSIRKIGVSDDSLQPYHLFISKSF